MIVSRVIDLIGDTPLFKISLGNNKWNVYLKLEKYNPGGSMKDRMALNMIEVAEKEGRLYPGGTIIESSSGNTAIGLAIASIAKGYKFIAVVDHHTSEEKIKIIKALGGEIVIVGDGYKENEVAVIEREKKAKELAEIMENAFFPNQADNFANRSAYVDTLADELCDELETIDEFYAAIGTGGSICGTAIGLRKRNQNVKVTAIEPEGSILFGGHGKPYFQSGTGNPVNAPIPNIIEYSLINRNLYATDKEAFNTCRYMAKRFGLLIGGSAGGVLYKALEDLNQKKGFGTAVILLCDGGEKYLDTIFNDVWMLNNQLLDDQISVNLHQWLKENA